MTKKNKIPVCTAAAFLLILVNNAHAEPQFSFTSPLSDASISIFGSYADHFMSVRDYADMEFNKNLSIVSYKRQYGSRWPGEVKKEYDSIHLTQFGFATELGSLYLAASYIGNGWMNFAVSERGDMNIQSYSNETLPSPAGWSDTGNKTWKVFDKEFPNLSRNNKFEIWNEAAVLLGFADMGFMLYYSSNYRSNNQSEFAVRSASNNLTFYKSYKEELGYINPGIVWGMTRALIPGWGLKPELKLDFNIFRLNLKQENYDFFTGDPGGMFITSGISQNVFIPGLDFSLGGIYLAVFDNFKIKADLDYGINLYLYDNEYSYTGADGKWHIKRIQGGMSKTSTDLRDIFKINHSLKPAIKTEWLSDKLRLAAWLSMNMVFSSSNDAQKTIKAGSYDGTLVKDGNDDTETIFDFFPKLDLAMSWSIVPQKLCLNAGAEVIFFDINYKTRDRRVYSDDIEDISLSEYSLWENYLPASTVLRLGAAFNITRHIELQAVLGVSAGNVINVFNTTQGQGFLGFTNILLTLKY